MADQTPGPVDHFISYNQADRAWAEWIAWELESAGHSTLIQAWDFAPGSNFVHEMHEAVRRARQVIAVMSPAYFSSRFGEAEWQAAFADDPTGTGRRLVPVRVAEVDPPGLLRTLVYVDLVNRNPAEARDALSRASPRRWRALPERPAFPVPGRRRSGTSPASPGTSRS